MDPLLLLASTDTGGLACLPPEDREEDQEGNGDGVGRLDRKSPCWYKLTTSPGRETDCDALSKMWLHQL